MGATIHYYQKLARAHEAQGYTMDIVIAHAEVSRVFEYVQAGDRDGLAGYLIGYIDRLRIAGAEFAAIPAITPHYCVRELVAASPPQEQLPQLIDITDSTGIKFDHRSSPSKNTLSSR